MAMRKEMAHSGCAWDRGGRARGALFDKWMIGVSGRAQRGLGGGGRGVVGNWSRTGREVVGLNREGAKEAESIKESLT